MDLADDETLEAAADLAFGLAFLDASGDGVAGGWVPWHADQHDAVERGVGVPVAGSVSAVSALQPGRHVSR